MTATSDAVPPIRTVCMCCGAVLVDVPEDDRGVSHGICSVEEWREWERKRQSEKADATV